MTDNIEKLCQEWAWHKQQEQEAQAKRRECEDAIKAALNVPETMEGTATHEAGDYEVRLTGRMNRKVDADALQEIARDNGIGFDHLQRLFRWKAEINASAFKAADQNITGPLMGAITTSPGRPSFSIKLKESNHATE